MWKTGSRVGSRRSFGCTRTISVREPQSLLEIEPVVASLEACLSLEELVQNLASRPRVQTDSGNFGRLTFLPGGLDLGTKSNANRRQTDTSPCANTCFPVRVCRVNHHSKEALYVKESIGVVIAGVWLVRHGFSMLQDGATRGCRETRRFDVNGSFVQDREAEGGVAISDSRGARWSCGLRWRCCRCGGQWQFQRQLLH